MEGNKINYEFQNHYISYLTMSIALLAAFFAIYLSLLSVPVPKI